MTRTTQNRFAEAAQCFPDLGDWRQYTTRLHPRRGAPGIRDSSVGGPLLWPEGEEWPRCGMKHIDLGVVPPPDELVPLVPILQLFRSDVSDLPYPRGTDLFQMLWCPYDHEPHYAPRPELYWRETASVRPRSGEPPQPEVAIEDYLPEPCVVHPERVIEFPGHNNLPDSLYRELKKHFETFRVSAGGTGVDEDDISVVAPGIKIGGFPGFTQDPSWPECAGCGMEMDHLATIASWEYDGYPEGNPWIPVEDRGSVPDSVSSWAETVVRNAAGLMLGDVGGVYVFVCGRCPERPYDHRFDCS